MPNIRSSADLRNNYNDISSYCHAYNEPVFITKNGKGDLAVMSMETYEEMAGRIELYSKLQDVTQAAERDMANAYDYIDLVLKNPTAADKLLDVADEKIGALAEFPHKFEVVSDKLLSLWGIRFTIVMNYLAFYTVDDATQTVHIVRFLYGKSNWITILKTDAANGSLPVFS